MEGVGLNSRNLCICKLINNQNLALLKSVANINDKLNLFPNVERLAYTL